MIVSLYQDTEKALIRIANTVLSETRQATFTADANWEVTHYGMMETAGGPSILDPLREPVAIDKGNSLTLDLKNVRFEFTKTNDDVAELHWPDLIDQ